VIAPLLALALVAQTASTTMQSDLGPPVGAPRGGAVAYVRTGVPPGVYVYRGGRTTRVGRPEPFPNSWSVEPALEWSPDGRRVAFVDRRSGLVAATSSGAVRVLEPGRKIDDFEWSPVGDRIAYATKFPDDVREVRVARKDGTGRIALASDPDMGLSSVEGLVWAPDGDSLAYVGGTWLGPPDVEWQLRVARVAGGPPKTVMGVGRPYGLRCPAWSPTGSLAYAFFDNSERGSTGPPRVEIFENPFTGASAVGTHVIGVPIAWSRLGRLLIETPAW
jgi:Tol biopolymer transport system component